jgi:hypothetical protein
VTCCIKGVIEPTGTAGGDQNAMLGVTVGGGVPEAVTVGFNSLKLPGAPPARTKLIDPAMRFVTGILAGTAVIMCLSGSVAEAAIVAIPPILQFSMDKVSGAPTLSVRVTATGGLDVLEH